MLDGNNPTYEALKELADEVNEKCGDSYRAKVNYFGCMVIFEMYMIEDACMVDYTRLWVGAKKQVVQEYCNYVRHAINLI